MTPKMQKFVDEYLVDLNATQAAIRAGYSKKTAYSIGVSNLKKPEIQAAIQKRQKSAAEKLEIIIEEAKLISGIRRSDRARYKNLPE